MGAGLRSFSIAVLFLLLAAPAAAEKRVALVIGNNDYPSLTAEEQLKRAVNDANSVGDALEAIGFEVARGENVTRGELLASLFTTANMLSEGDIAFFFYAGHGVSIDGANYLLPSDIPPAESGAEELVKASAISESMVVETLKARGVRVAVIVLDACRNNPFTQGGTRAFGDATRGLTRPPSVQPQGVFGLYSAGFGEQALDGLGDDDSSPNSVFTRVLAPALVEPGQSLLDIAYRVNDEVAQLAKSVGHDQNPAYYDQARARDVFLVEAAAAESEVSSTPPEAASSPSGGAQSATSDPCTAASVHFEAARSIGRIEALEDHLAKFPSCQFADLARILIDGLRADAANTVEQEVAALPDPVAEAETPPNPAVDNPERLGVEIQDVPDDAIAESLYGLTEATGAVVVGVIPGTPAADAKIQNGDVLLEFGGQPIADMRHLLEMIAAVSPNQTVEVTLFRNRQRLTVDVMFVPDAPAAAATLQDTEVNLTALEEDSSRASAECSRLSAANPTAAEELQAANRACREAQYKALRVAAEYGDAESQYVVGTMTEEGSGEAQSDIEAVKWYQLAVAQDYGDAHWRLGLMYQSGRGGLSESVPQAMHHVMRALWRKSEAARTELIDGRGASLTNAVREAIQDNLKGLGYYSGNIDGTFDQATIAALEKFSNS